jgi:hypothetical protein
MFYQMFYHLLTPRPPECDMLLVMQPIAQLNSHHGNGVPIHSDAANRPMFPPRFGGKAPPNGGRPACSRREKYFDGGGGKASQSSSPVFSSALSTQHFLLQVLQRQSFSPLLHKSPRNTS